MSKKSQKIMRWLVITAIFTGLTGCSLQSTDTPALKKQASQPAAENRKSVDKATPGKKDTAAEKKQQLPIVTAKSKDVTPAKKSLSAEVLYYLLSAEIAAQRGKLGLSAALYVRAAEVTRDARVAQRATRTAYYIRDDKLSMKAAMLWYQLEPANVEVRQVLGALLIRSGEPEKATEHFEFVIEHSQQNERKGFMLITTLLSKEKNKEAGLKVMRKLLSTRQDNPDALYAYSQLAFVLGETDEAEKSIARVISLQPRWIEAYILQSNIFVRKGAKAHSLKVLKKAVEEYDDFDKLRMYYARKLVDARQYDEATTQFSILLDADENNYEARYALGLLALQMNRADDAEGYFKTLIQAENRVAESQYYLAQALELKNELDEAISWYEKINSQELSFEASLRIAIIHSRQGRLKEARVLLHNISADSMDNEIRLYLVEGEILNNAKLYPEALSLFNEALRTLTDNPRLLYARALTLEKVGKVEEAIADLKTIVKREPANAQALNALGYTMVDRTDKVEEGFEYIKQAYKLLPDDAAILDSMGWANYRLGNYSESIRYLRLAFKKLKDAEIAAHLGEVLWVSGERDEAQEIWNTALEVSPDDTLLLNVIQKFAE